MENMGNMETFKKKDTSEAIATVYREAPEKQRLADVEAAERGILSRFVRSRTEAQDKVVSEKLNAEQAFKKFEAEIQAEAQEYVDAYGEYKTRLERLAAAQGIDAKPTSINTFIAKMDAVANLYDSVPVHVKYEDGTTEEERESKREERQKEREQSTFFGSPEGREKRIQAAVLNELFTQEIPAGATVETVKYKESLVTEAPIYVPRGGADRATAIKQAREQGSRYILQAESHFTLNEKGTVEFNEKDPSTSYMVISEEVANTMMQNGRMSVPYDLGDSPDKEAVLGEYSLRYMDPSFAVKDVASIEKEQMPIQVGVTVGGGEILLSCIEVDDAVRKIKEIASRALERSIEDLQKLRINLPDGRSLGIGELGREDLEGSRVERSQEKAA